MKPDIFNQKGITLIELMVAMAIAGIVAAAMFAFQQSQTRSYVTQEQITVMQQNARAAIHFMTSELRMAGFDSGGAAGAGIEDASGNMIHFTMDFLSEPETSGDYTTVPVEKVSLDDTVYTFGVPDDAIDQPGEEIVYRLNDGNIIRDDVLGAGESIIARNFDALNFVYYDGNGNRIPEANLSNRLDDIRTVLVTILVRSGEGSPGFVFRHSDNQTYNNREGDTLYSADDNFRRILLSTEVRLRNM